MRYIVSYYTVSGDHIFSKPTFDGRLEYIDASSLKDLEKYICNKSDLWGHPYKANKAYNKSDAISREFFCISKQGGVTIDEFREPKTPKFRKI